MSRMLVVLGVVLVTGCGHEAPIKEIPPLGGSPQGYCDGKPGYITPPKSVACPRPQWGCYAWVDDRGGVHMDWLLSCD